MTTRLMDDDGVPVTAGDTIRFSYGIPPVVVEAKIIERDGRLVALSPGHTPAECKLRSLRNYVGNWYKTNVPVTRGSEPSRPAAGSAPCQRTDCVRNESGHCRDNHHPVEDGQTRCRPIDGREVRGAAPRNLHGLVGGAS